MKYKTKWDLSHIYPKEPKKLAEKDCADLKKAYLVFSKKYKKDKNYLKNARALARALEDYEKLIKHPASDRPSSYYTYRKCLNGEDTEAVAQMAKLSDFHANLGNEIKFFLLDIGKLPAVLQKKFLVAKELEEFRYFLKIVFNNAKYKLSEPEEKIMSLKALPSHQLWTSGFSKLLSKQTVKFGRENLPLAEASAKISTLSTNKRRTLHLEFMRALKNVSDFAESEINAIVTNKKIGDNLRGFKLPYQATVLGYQNEIKTVENLVKAVTSNMKIAHRFFKIKARMLGEKTLMYADRGAKVGEVDVKIPFKNAVEKTIKAFNIADPVFGSFVAEMFEKGLVDAFPKKGKQGGAFCSSGTALPSYILLNHIDDFKSITTLAHEMGHALHAKYSKKQRPLYEDHTIATAEVASTFFENLVFEQALNDVSLKEKIILLHDKISDDIGTIFRQIACFNFENELHETIRKEGFLPKDKIAELMNKHMQNYLGPNFKLTLDDGYFFVNWSHIRNFFYVYSYAFGQLVSDALYERYKKDKTKIKDVIKFLSAGESNSPEGIFRSIGINPTKKFFETGLKKIERNIIELEKLWRASEKNV